MLPSRTGALSAANLFSLTFDLVLPNSAGPYELTFAIGRQGHPMCDPLVHVVQPSR